MKYKALFMKQKITLVIAMVAVMLLAASCKKDTTSNPGPKVASEALLTAHPWKPKVINGVVGNTIVMYQRGGTGNTQNYDNESITFDAAKTGTYNDINGKQYPLTWDFANTDKTKLTFTVQYTPNVSNVTWDNMVFTDSLLEYNQTYSIGGVNGHSHEIRMPK